MMVPPKQMPQPRVLADWVTSSIRDAILRGQFGPGDKLDQDLIATELQVSRTPVREALSKLEAEGFIEVRPHRGAFVILPSPNDIKETYEMLGIIESEVVRRVTPLIPESLISEMERRLSEDQEKLLLAEPGAYASIDSPRFPTGILDLIDNNLLRDIMTSLSNRVEIIRRFIRLQGPLLAGSLDEHKAILEAIRQRDAERASQLTRLHSERSVQRILSIRQGSESDES